MGLVYDKDRKVQITKEFTFDSAHFLKEYIGECSNLHGHTYYLLVTLEGYINDIGMLIDFKELKEIVDKNIISRLDHKCINHVLDSNPTAENMVCIIFDMLSEMINNTKVWVKRIELYETPTSKAICER